MNANTGSLGEWVPRCFGWLRGLVVVEQVTLCTVSSEVAQRLPAMGQALLAPWSGIEGRGKNQSQLDLKKRLSQNVICDIHII